MATSPHVARALVRGLLLAGAVGAGVAALNIGRRYQESDQKAIDWDQVRKIAVGISGGASLGSGARAELERQYRRWISDVEPQIAAYLHTTLPKPLETVFVFDRPQWIDANIANFRVLFAPLEEVYDDLIMRGSFRAGPVFGGINQLVASSQIGLLLGYLAKRVLGQYDVALLGREPMTSGKLYFLEQNIKASEIKLSIPADQFRLWICLHEATHAFEFEAHPWLATYLNEQIAEHMHLVTQQLRRIRLDASFLEETVHRVVRGITQGGHWVEMLMSDEQRRVFQRLQSTMSLLEGYSNHVMDRIGIQLMPDYEEIKRKFEQRRTKRSVTDQIWNKLTGLDLKIEQYSLGERFVNEVVAQRGIGFMNRIFDDPAHLPDMREIRHPQRWIERMEGSGRRALAISWG